LKGIVNDVKKEECSWLGDDYNFNTQAIYTVSRFFIARMQQPQLCTHHWDWPSSSSVYLTASATVEWRNVSH